MTTKAPEWREQYDRMLRWQERVCNHKLIDAHVIDDCHAFFTCCYHLKDWLRNDGVVTKKAVERYVTRNLWLSLCGDLANGSKHMLVKNLRYKDPSYIEPMLILNLDFGIQLLPVKAKLVVKQGTRTYRIEQVVNSSVTQWQGFLRDHKLIP